MRGKRMTVFLDETDQWHHRALYLAILDRLKAAGCAGATAVRGIAGFGPHSHIIKTARFVDVRMDLPMVITVIDLPDRIERFAAEVAGMLSGERSSSRMSRFTSTQRVSGAGSPT